MAARDDLNGLQDGVQASIDGIRELAAERARHFKREPVEANGSAPSTPELAWTHPSSNIDTSSHLKRRISEVSEPESQPARAPPTIQPPLYHPTSTVPVVDNTPIAPLAPSQPPKRRPDPNSDTIGSDLDDSEEESDIDDDEEAGEDNMPLMLCLYDKVSRTKNKWRSNMSHGIVCIDGREWVFERGNGEYEW